MDECNLWSQIVQQFKLTCSDFDGLWIKRRRLFNTETMVHLLFNLASGRDESYSTIIDKIFANSSHSPANSSFCEARVKFPSFLVGEIREVITDIFDNNTKGSDWHGYRIHAIDGTKISLPGALTKEGFKNPSGGYCPQGLVSLLLRVDDKMICDISLCAHENERLEAHKHLSYLSHNDLVIYDRGYLCFSLLTAHINTGIAAVFRVQRGGAFCAVDRFWKSKERDKIVTIDPSEPTYRSVRKDFPEYPLQPLKIRLVKYIIKKKTYVLATTILDQRIKTADIAGLYLQRWACEESYKALKKTLCFEAFHSQALNGVEQEIQAAALFWNLNRIFSTIASYFNKKKTDIGRWSIKPTSNKLYVIRLA